MNEIKVFNYQENEVRTVVKDNEMWWVLKDVCDVLKLGSPHKVAERLDEDEKGRNLIPTLGGPQEMTIINEMGLYSVILRSDKPEAKEFKRWVTHEVLPSIRKHGMYAIDDLINDPDLAIKALTALKEERARRKELEVQAEENQPKVLFADTVIKSSDNILIREMAKLLCDNDIKIGEKRLYKLLRENNVLMRNNIPYQYTIDQGYFFVKESTVRTVRTTLVTPKGQIWIINKIRMKNLYLNHLILMMTNLMLHC